MTKPKKIQFYILGVNRKCRWIY